MKVIDGQRANPAFYAVAGFNGLPLAGVDPGFLKPYQLSRRVRAAGKYPVIQVVPVFVDLTGNAEDPFLAEAGNPVDLPLGYTGISHKNFVDAIIQNQIRKGSGGKNVSVVLLSVNIMLKCIE